MSEAFKIQLGKNLKSYLVAKLCIFIAPGKVSIALRIKVRAFLYPETLSQSAIAYCLLPIAYSLALYEQVSTFF